MKSIRLSLIVYFLLLLVVGLGAVCLLFYLQTERTLAQKEESARQLYVKDFQNRSDAAFAQLDKQLLQQMRSLASRTRSSSVFYENLYPLGAIAAVTLPQGHLTVPLWVAEGYHSPLAFRLYKMRSYDILIVNRNEEILDDVYEEEVPDPQYYQLFRDNGKEMQRSPSMPTGGIARDEELRRLELYTERLDTAMIEGKKLRRAVFKGTVPKSRAGTLPIVMRWPPSWGKGFKSPPPRPSIFENPAPVFILVCAIDTEGVDNTIANYQRELDQNLTHLEQETRDDLAKLRLKLFWIGLATLAGLAVGALGLLWLGLLPLNRLSDAVSRVSEKDFQLKVDAVKLPRELQPIAERMKVTLQQLEKAFEREKQASADISHELRTPLAALLTNIDVTLRKNRTAQEYREILEECRASGQQMYHLVERLLALARLDAGAVQLKAKVIDAGTVARQCANLIKPLAEERGLSLNVNTSDEMLLKADPDKLREVLTNLLHNAIEYNKPRGSIDLSVQRENGHVRMLVKDTGIGISAQAKERIFERFFRADPSRQADTPHAGLGLSIVKSYVDLMGGSITVDSSEAGTTFAVSLPATEEGAPQRDDMFMAIT